MALRSIQRYRVSKQSHSINWCLLPFGLKLEMFRKRRAYLKRRRRLALQKVPIQAPLSKLKGPPLQSNTDSDAMSEKTSIPRQTTEILEEKVEAVEAGTARNLEPTSRSKTLMLRANEQTPMVRESESEGAHHTCSSGPVRNNKRVAAHVSIEQPLPGKKPRLSDGSGNEIRKRFEHSNLRPTGNLTEDQKTVEKAAKPVIQPATARPRLGPLLLEYNIRAQRGLPNITGVACYRNSLMQAMLHVPALASWGVEQHSRSSGRQTSKCVLSNLLSLFHSYWINPGAKLGALLRETQLIYRKKRWEGSCPKQKDPQEQFIWMHEQMEKEMAAPSYKMWKALTTCVLQSTITCGKCGHKSTTRHEDIGLSLPLRPRSKNGDLTSLICQYLVERLDYRCERCKTLARNLRTQFMAVTPACLVIQLKRFDYTGNKDNCHVPFTTTLDLTPHSKGNGLAAIYDLCAVVSHAGSVRSGHYVCLAKGPGGQWKEFDDEVVRPVKDVIAATRAQGNGSFTPYLLFFQCRT